MSLILLTRFKVALLTGFNEQLAARASLVAARTTIQPRIVPLPQGTEAFDIIYRAATFTDTLFTAANTTFVYPIPPATTASGNGWRSIILRDTLDSGGILEITYALPSEVIDKQIKGLSNLIWLILPAGCVFAFLVAYWLSARLLKPVKQVVNMANSINLNNTTEILKEPSVNDELKELIVSFNRMLVRIRDQSDRQAAFFASASHELRTPLSVMQTRLEVLLRDQSQTGSGREIYADQLNEVQQLNKMVNDFLLLSELRNGRMIVNRVDLNLPDLLLSVITRYNPKAIAKSIVFKVNYSDVSDTYEVVADGEKTNIIFSNLLHNCVKYSRENTVINCNIANTTEFVSVAISNTMREDISPRIDELKRQFYHSKPIEGEGFGLGLWIANQLADMQGMHLSFEVVNETRCFTSTLKIFRQI